jgi:lipase maturation factor 1
VSGAEVPFDRPFARALARWFGPDGSTPGHVWARWLWLRALGLLFLSAFYSLAYQIHALIGPEGILPAGAYLAALRKAFPIGWVYEAPTLLWLGAGDRALTALVFVGLLASVLLTLNVAPRVSIAVAGVCFLSFTSAARDFSNYQSDGMLLEAAFASFFFAPRGLKPGLAPEQPPSKATLWLLRWEWFRIYFESGVVKLASGDEAWRTLRAMDHYYENGPLPTWVGWYAQQALPRWFHTATSLFTLVLELGIVWAIFLPRRFKIALFVLVTQLQIGIILTANYAFLNYLVLALGVLLLDDRALASVKLKTPSAPTIRDSKAWRLWGAAATLGWIFYATVAVFLFGFADGGPLAIPAQILAPFRIANRYGLFAVMTPARYEIEFQGSVDGKTWIPYPFRYKPQDIFAAPRIYAPYQPRFEWNLWFASLGRWQDDPWVVKTAARLLDGAPPVVRLFARDPFDGVPPVRVRTVLWQYWFTDQATKRATGAWWKREEIATYAPTLARQPDGSIVTVSDY